MQEITLQVAFNGDSRGIVNMAMLEIRGMEYARTKNFAVEMVSQERKTKSFLCGLVSELLIANSWNAYLVPSPSESRTMEVRLPIPHLWYSPPLDAKVDKFHLTYIRRARAHGLQ